MSIIRKNESFPERWRYIDGFDRKYMISDHGNVVSLMNDHTIKLIPNTNRKGYFRVWLYCDKKRMEYKIHHLVAMSFLGYIKGSKLMINHKDEIKSNNHYSNLEICDNRYNVSFSIKNKKRSSQFVGVCWAKNAKRWGARIRINGTYKHLGYFKNENEAHQAYQNELNTIKNLEYVN